MLSHPGLSRFVKPWWVHVTRWDSRRVPWQIFRFLGFCCVFLGLDFVIGFLRVATDFNSKKTMHPESDSHSTITTLLEVWWPYPWWSWCLEHTHRSRSFRPVCSPKNLPKSSDTSRVETRGRVGEGLSTLGRNSLVEVLVRCETTKDGTVSDYISKSFINNWRRIHSPGPLYDPLPRVYQRWE